MSKGPALRDALPAWARERRQPTRAELAAKYFADGGRVASGSGNTLPDDEPEGTEFELVPLSETSPNILVRRPKAVPAQDIKVKRYNV
jgi:hypothetical protein